MSTEKQQHIYIFDHPESRVHFLEATLDGKDWRATIVYPDATVTSQQALLATKSALENRGYVLQSGQDAYGHATLDVHHLGVGITPVELIREVGLGRGVVHTLMHPAMSLGEYLDRGQRMLQHGVKLAHDPARANGLLYMLAEGFLIFAGFGNKHGNILQLKNALQSLGGAFFFGQSGLYALFAKNNDEIALDSIAKKIDGIKVGKVDFSRIHYDPLQDMPQPGIGHAIIRTLHKYPIQIGALFNDIGMMAYLGHAILERKSWQRVLLTDPHNAQGLDYVNKAFRYELGSIAASTVGWAFLCLKPKVHHDTDPAPSNIFSQAWDKLRENPQFVSGGLTLASSSQRLIAARAKRNKMQTIGESIYLPGDFMLFFTKSDHYGSDSIHDVAGIAKKIAEYVNGLPVVLGAQSQRSTVESIAEYLTEKRIATLEHEHKLTPEIKATLMERHHELIAATLPHIAPEQNARLKQVTEVAGRIIQRFPDTVQGELQTRLTQSMVNMPWLQTSTDELQQMMQQFPAPARHNMSKLVQMKDIAADIATLMQIVPDIDRTASATALYEAFAPYLRTQASDTDRMHRAISGRSLIARSAASAENAVRII
jgi:hypothetical protein